MEEKKLTEEGIVKAVEFQKGRGIPYLDGYTTKSVMFNDVLDLIHRLQDENEQLKCNSYCTSWKGKFFEAKKEIERLTEKNNEIFQRYLNVIDKNNDLQNQVDKVEAEKENLYRSNERLQKQVDELKTENKELYKEHTTLIAGSILKQQDIVKDTAREILQELYEYPHEYHERKILEIAKRYGVEELQNG